MASLGLLEKFKTFLNVFSSHPTCFINVFLAGLSAGGEQLFEFFVLECPPKDNRMYALYMMISPALSLWILSILGNNYIRKRLQGYIKSTSNVCSCGICCFQFIIILFQSLPIPVAWLFVTLLDGDTYACLKRLPNCTNSDVVSVVDSTIEVTTVAASMLTLGPNETSVEPCFQNPEIENLTNKRFSVILAWRLLLCLLFIVLIEQICTRCFAKRTYIHSIYAEITNDAEKEQMNKLMRKRAEEKATQNITALLYAKEVKKEDWDKLALEDVQDEGKISNCHSGLQEWGSCRKPLNKATKTNMELQTLAGDVV